MVELSFLLILGGRMHSVMWIHIQDVLRFVGTCSLEVEGVHFPSVFIEIMQVLSLRCYQGTY